MTNYEARREIVSAMARLARHESLSDETLDAFIMAQRALKVYGGLLDRETRMKTVAQFYVKEIMRDEEY